MTGVGNSCHATVEADGRILELAAKQPKRPGRGAGGQRASACRGLLEKYRSLQLSLPPSDRLCCALTLVKYPGVKKTGDRQEIVDSYGNRRIGRPGSDYKDGSKRIRLAPELDDLIKELGPLALSLQMDEDQHAGASPDRVDRPVTDAVMTAVILATGPLTNGLFGSIDHQLISQGLARRLWHMAMGEEAETRPRVRRRLAVERLSERLPRLLAGDDEQFQTLCWTAPTWEGSLDELIKFIDSPPQLAVPGMEMVRPETRALAGGQR